MVFDIALFLELAQAMGAVKGRVHSLGIMVVSLGLKDPLFVYDTSAH